MTYSNALYQPSILELAQEGNCRALTYWMNSFLSPQGIYVQVHPASDHFLKILVSFRKPRQKEACLRMRDRLVRFICYRLWTLNSVAIRGARIVARIPGDSRILWQLSVRINSPAAAKVRRTEQMSLRQLQAAHQFKFRVFRSLFMSSITLAGFFVGYWLFYAEFGKFLTREKSANASVLAAGIRSSEVETPEVGSESLDAAPQIPAPPGQANFPIPESFRGEVTSQVSVPEPVKAIALTFDDGPHPEVTAEILSILKQHNTKATFFMSGENIKQSPEMARRVVSEGHAVGNRGWHQGLETGKAADPVREIDDTTNLIEEVTGAKTELFRPPDGRLNNKLIAHAKQQEYAIMLWSVDSQDSLVAAPILLDNVLRNAQPGRIVLLHDGLSKTGPSATVQALPQLITALQQQGYQFVTVPQLLKLQAVPERQKDTKIPFRKQSIAAVRAKAEAVLSRVEWSQANPQEKRSLLSAATQNE